MLYTNISPNLAISKLILGTWQLATNHANSANNEVNENDILYSYLKNNITTITSANLYKGAEEKIGRFVETHRDDFLSSKLPKPQILTLFTDLPNQLKSLTRKQVISIVDSALQKLQVEAIDLMQYFCWGLEDSYYIQIGQWLQDAQKDGKINSIGVSNVDTSTLKALLDNNIPIVSNQIQYSLLDRRAEITLQKFCKENGIWILAYGTMAGGILSNNYLNKSKNDILQNASMRKYCRTIEIVGGWNTFQSMLSKLNILATEKNISISQLVCSYILNQDAVAAVILGAHNTKNINANLDILNITFNEDEIAAIESALACLQRIDGDIYQEELRYEKAHGRLKDQ